MRWKAIAVEPSEHSAGFVYSAGFMASFGHPEVIVFGLDPDEGYAILAVLAEDLASGRSYAEPGEYDGVVVDGLVAIRPVHESQHEIYLGYAMEAARLGGGTAELHAVQLFWRDSQGRFPFQLGCDPLVAHVQPRLEFAVPPSKRLGVLDEEP